MIHALISGVIAFAVSVVIGWPILRYLKAQKGKSISEYAPDTHQKKAGTPTFGGLMIWAPTFLVAVIAVDWWDHRSILLPLAVIGATGVVGFVDDLGTLQHRTQKGLSWTFKLVFLTFLAFGAAYVLYDHIEVQSINVPWAGSWALGLFYIPIAAAVIVSFTTAVAVTDGLDALAGGTTLIAFIAYGIIAFIQGQEFVATFSFIIAGANLGFVWYNAHPASVFMGDTGALALGSSLAVVALMTGHWLLLPIIGFIFFIEGMSDVIQVGYYKLTGGKRFFRQAPIHHHFERVGWAETQIVTRAWVISIAMAMLGVAFALAVPE